MQPYADDHRPPLGIQHRGSLNPRRRALQRLGAEHLIVSDELTALAVIVEFNRECNIDITDSEPMWYFLTIIASVDTRSSGERDLYDTVTGLIIINLGGRDSEREVQTVFIRII